MNTTKKIVAGLGLGALMLTGLAVIGATPAKADGLSFSDYNGRISVGYTQGCAPAPVYVAPTYYAPAPVYLAPQPVIVERDGHRGFDRDHRGGDWNRGRR